MGMNNRLLRPRQSLHAETVNWASRVVANGGTVSGSTVAAVDRFVKAIHAAGIRDRFLRVNLFCGNSDASLAAVRTPLFRGQSLTGTQFGNTTDTNVNFVAGDYAETGASGGLTGDGVNKRLTTGPSVMSNATASNGHASIYGNDLSAGSAIDRNPIGVLSAGFTAIVLLNMRQSGANANRAYLGTTTEMTGSPVATAGHLLWSATSATQMQLFSGGTQTGSLATNRGSDALSALSVGLFHSNNNGSPVNHSAARLMAYSVGLGMDATQALAYYNAMQAFQTALGRQV